MNDRLKHFKSLPRRTLQYEIRQYTGDQDFYLWEFIGLNWHYMEIRADRPSAAFFGLPDDAVIGYHVIAGEVFGGAFGDLMNVNAAEAPYPDPFK
jgi:hypothetical protein